MIKFKALNDQESFSEDSDVPSNNITREAQEELLNKLYYDALQAASKNDNQEAIDLLNELKVKLESGNCIIHDTVHLERLKYLTYKNIGLFSNDIQSILKSLEIDSSDFNLWISAGRKSKEAGQFFVSKYCFETAFKMSPHNIVVIENLLEVFYVVNDFYDCANMCIYALRLDPEYSKALILLEECLTFDKILIKDLDKECLKFVSHKHGGTFDMEILLSNNKFDSYKSNLLKKLRKQQRQLFKSFNPEENGPHKKKELILESEKCSNMKDIGKIILGFYETIENDKLSISTKIIFKDDELPPDVPMIEETSDKSTQELLPQESTELEQTKESQESMEFNPADFVDKRRSTRNRRVNKAEDSQETKSELDQLLELFPSSFKNLSNSPITNKDNNQFSKHLDEENTSFTKEFMREFREEFKAKNNKLNIYQLIRFYLIKVSSFKNFVIPEEFMKLYKIYRQFEPLPGSYEIKIPEDISFELIQVCLTANELVYNPLESSFLQEIMGNLCEKMDQTLYREFIIRLQVLLGNAKWDSDHISYARDLCKAKPEFDFVFGMNIPDEGKEIQVYASNQLLIDAAYLDNSLEMLNCTSDDEQFIHFKEIIRSLFTKPEINLTDDKKDSICDAIIALKIWDKGLNLIDSWNKLTDKCFDVVFECIAKNGLEITPNLVKKVAKKAIEGKSLLLWKILRFVLVNECSDIETMARFYQMSHVILGRNGLCTSDQGEFLLEACVYFKDANFVEDAMHSYACLFDYPIKNKLHEAKSIPLEWKHCDGIFELYKPLSDDDLPGYDSSKSVFRITSKEEKSLLTNMLQLIPPGMTPVKASKFVKNFIENGDLFDENIEEKLPKANGVTSYIYYYLADYYFNHKKDFDKAKIYYIFDLSLNPQRFYSWAGLALSYTHDIEEMFDKLSPNYSDYLQKVFSASQCFEKALALICCNTIHIEYGLVMYSFACFLNHRKKLKEIFGKDIYPEPDVINENITNLLTYEFALGKSKECFEWLDDTEDLQERWLVKYMLGKISEKQPSNIHKTLEYYEKASIYLYLEGAAYPKRIQFVQNRVPNLSFEALELHYRTHSAILKYLERNSKFSARNLRKIKLHLIKTQKSPFVTRKQFHEKKSGNDEDIDLQASECLNDLLNIVYERDKIFDVNTHRNDLITICKNEIFKCLERYQNFYKSYYRYATECDPKTVFGLLLGSIQLNRQNPLLCFPSDGKKNGPSVVPGLFSLEKDFFGKLWRIPVDEIERTGKFASHVFRILNLMIDTCKHLDDYKTLHALAPILKKEPEINKRFLNEPERIALAEKVEITLNSVLNELLRKIQNREMTQENYLKLCQQLTPLFKR